MAQKKAFQQRTASSGNPALDGWLDLIWQLIKSDVYTPTLTDVTNLDGSTAFQVPYARIGDWVGVGLRFNANPALGAPTATELGISLPIPSNFTDADTDAMGVAAASAIQQSVRVLADVTNKRLSLQWSASDTANRNFSGVAFYRIK